eukprot:scaffold7206_cov500-Prasinococcus_capsulatus_cf.AAC.3
MVSQAGVQVTHTDRTYTTYGKCLCCKRHAASYVQLQPPLQCRRLSLRRPPALPTGEAARAEPLPGWHT